ncbi:hypothetical protein C0058_12595 [Pseudomonas sp. NC02]|nr:hypothetical protein C0058_12595 [Pseudomonas sp. NC02]
MPILAYFVSHHFYKHKAEKAYRLNQVSPWLDTVPLIIDVKPIKQGIYQVFTDQHSEQFIFIKLKTRHTKSILSLHLCITLKLYSGKTG